MQTLPQKRQRLVYIHSPIQNVLKKLVNINWYNYNNVLCTCICFSAPINSFVVLCLTQGHGHCPCSTQTTRVGLLSLAWPKPQGWGYCPLLNPSPTGWAWPELQECTFAWLSPQPQAIIGCFTQFTRTGLLSIVSLNPQGWGCYHLFHSNHKGGAIITCFTQSTGVGILSLVSLNPQGWGYCDYCQLFHSTTRAGLLSVAWFNPQGWGYHQLLGSTHKGGAIISCLAQPTRVGLLSVASLNPQACSYCRLPNSNHNCHLSTSNQKDGENVYLLSCKTSLRNSVLWKVKQSGVVNVDHS